MNKRIMSWILTFTLCLSMLPVSPVTAYAAEGTTIGAGGLCDHHTEHNEACGFIEAVPGAECTHRHDETCALYEAPADPVCTCETKCAADAINSDCPVCSAEGADLTACTGQEAPVCTCDTDDDVIHATNCLAYVAPENPECFCVEKCTEDTLNVWCDVCGVEGAAACLGAAEMAAFATSPTSMKLGGVEMVSGTTTTYWVNGSDTAETEEPTSWNAKLEWPNGSNGTPVLTLSGAQITGSANNKYGAGIYADGNLEIILTGANSTVTAAIPSDSDDKTMDAIYIHNGLKVSSTSNVELHADSTVTGDTSNISYINGIRVYAPGIEISGSAVVRCTGGDGQRSTVQSTGVNVTGDITVSDNAKLIGSGGNAPGTTNGGSVGVQGYNLTISDNAVVSGTGAATASASKGLSTENISVYGSAQLSGKSEGTAQSTGASIGGTSAISISGGWVEFIANPNATQSYSIYGYSATVNVSGGSFLASGNGMYVSNPVQIGGYSLIWRNNSSGTYEYLAAEDTKKFNYPRNLAYLEVLPTYGITLTTDGNGTASASGTGVTDATNSSIFWAGAGTEVTLSAAPNEGYQFKEWQVVNGSITITDNKFTASAAAEVKAVFERAHSWTGEWGSSDTHHWKECTDSDCDVTDNSSKGSYGEHSFTLETVKDEALKSAANCTDLATYYKSCECGAVSTSDTDTFTSGSALGHSWADTWSKDATRHWHECQNDNCPVSENSGKDGYAAHTPGAAATETTPQTCAICGYEISPVLGHTHSYGAWQSNGNGTHARTCSGNSDHKETVSCSGGTATCKDKAICSVCNTSYGSVNSSNHAGGTEIRNASAATATEDGYTGDTHCKGCGVKLKTGTIIPTTGSGTDTPAPDTGGNGGTDTPAPDAGGNDGTTTPAPDAGGDSGTTTLVPDVGGDNGTDTPTPDDSTSLEMGFTEGEDGAKYWYEDGELQGTEGSGKEIYDPATDAWYWLDAAEGGKIVTDKDVYQESNGGKWVRYDEEGRMVKGEDYRYEGWYYFDQVTGAMAKGPAILPDGRKVFYDTVTGQMLKGEHNISGWTYVFDENDGHLISGSESLFWVEIDGKWYWYENWQRQGYDPSNEAYRGKEIYDPSSDAWYWLDNIQQGAMAKGKDVYQESYAGIWGDIEGEDGQRYGKWVRYDENGRMIKGWHTNENGTYYFDLITGTMAKGWAEIDGNTYYFDETTGILR